MGIPIPHSSDSEENPLIPGEKVQPTIAEDSDWVRVPDRPGLWKHRKTGHLIYIPPVQGIRQTPT